MHKTTLVYKMCRICFNRKVYNIVYTAFKVMTSLTNNSRHLKNKLRGIQFLGVKNNRELYKSKKIQVNGRGGFSQLYFLICPKTNKKINGNLFLFLNVQQRWLKPKIQSGAYRRPKNKRIVENGRPDTFLVSKHSLKFLTKFYRHFLIQSDFF